MRLVDAAVLFATLGAVYLLWDLRELVQEPPASPIRIEYVKTFPDGRAPAKITVPKQPGAGDDQWQQELRKIARELEAFHE